MNKLRHNNSLRTYFSIAFMTVGTIAITSLVACHPTHKRSDKDAVENTQTNDSGKISTVDEPAEAYDEAAIPAKKIAPKPQIKTKKIKNVEVDS